MAADIEKTGDERLRNMLQLALTHLAAATDHPYPERVNQFMDSNAEMILAGLVDPNRVDVANVVRVAQTRFQNAATPSGVPVTSVLIAQIPDLEAWITETL